uniref:PHD-type domain-containing protein n=1 Tax=Heterorhabditis bacteriophora TaxID=37862 RepID=A0A1I7XAK4_HETBA
MAAFADTIKALSLRCGDRINPLTFCNIQHQDDSKLSPERKSAASILSYKKVTSFHGGIIYLIISSVHSCLSLQQVKRIDYHRTVMACHIYPKVSGYVVDVNFPHLLLFAVVFVRTLAVLSSKRVMDDGHMLSVQFGLMKQKMGACLQCSTRSCLKAFHVTCAQQSGMAMKVHANPDPSSTDQVDVQRFVFCHLHADDDDCDATSRKKRMDDAIRQARRSMATKSSRTPRVKCVQDMLYE